MVAGPHKHLVQVAVQDIHILGPCFGDHRFREPHNHHVSIERTVERVGQARVFVPPGENHFTSRAGTDWVSCRASQIDAVVVDEVSAQVHAIGKGTGVREPLVGRNQPAVNGEVVARLRDQVGPWLTFMGIDNRGRGGCLRGCRRRCGRRGLRGCGSRCGSRRDRVCGRKSRCGRGRGRKGRGHRWRRRLGRCKQRIGLLFGLAKERQGGDCRCGPGSGGIRPGHLDVLRSRGVHLWDPGRSQEQIHDQGQCTSPTGAQRDIKPWNRSLYQQRADGCQQQMQSGHAGLGEASLT